MTERYTNNFRKLGVSRDVTWKQLRQAYKSLVNLWHPDRFQQDASKQKQAEEKTKEITQAYKELAEYYKKFGGLPPVAQVAEIADSDRPIPRAGPETDTSQQPPDSEVASDITAPPRRHKSWRFRLTPRSVAGAALGIVAYFTWQVIPWERSTESTDSVKDSNPAEEPSTIEEPVRHASPDETYITIGSPLGEVVSIQGVPTRTENDVWYYGKSIILFSKGRVVRWQEDPENPLHVKVSTESEKMGMMFFGTGSSKEEVLAVQGVPDRDAGDVWEYGVSQVYFENNRVKGWNESPFNPLRVRQ